MFAGDVGCGKTALAESFGCDLADSLDLPVFLYRLKLTARGSGLVGEMTTLIGDAFAHLLTQGRKARGASGPGSVFILVVDEADALAQSRAAEQMHHEDRAGVDALLAGVDTLAGEAVPVLVVLCTNRERAPRPGGPAPRRRDLPLRPARRNPAARRPGRRPRRRRDRHQDDQQARRAHRPGR